MPISVQQKRDNDPPLSVAIAHFRATEHLFFIRLHVEVGIVWVGWKIPGIKLRDSLLNFPEHNWQRMHNRIK